MDQISIYGADWCHDTRHTRSHLDEMGIPYRYIDIDRDPQAADWVKRQNDGQQKIPTLNVAGLVLSVPSNGELDTALRAKGILHG